MLIVGFDSFPRLSLFFCPFALVELGLDLILNTPINSKTRYRIIGPGDSNGLHDAVTTGLRAGRAAIFGTEATGM